MQGAVGLPSFHTARETRSGTYNEGMRDRGENGIFVHYVVHLFETDDLGLFEDFHRVKLLSLLIAREPHSPERAYRSTRASPVPSVCMIS